MKRTHHTEQISTVAKVSLYIMVVGFIFMFGGILHQIAIGISGIGVTDEKIERGIYAMLCYHQVLSRL